MRRRGVAVYAKAAEPQEFGDLKFGELKFGEMKWNRPIYGKKVDHKL